jgi:hypothetical protein
MWAARQLLPSTPIWPNMGHTLMLGIDFDVGTLQHTLAAKLPASASWRFASQTFPGFLMENGLVDGFIAQEYPHPGQVDFDASGLAYILQSDASTPLPPTSTYCVTGGFPWRAAFYLPTNSVPTSAAVAAVVPQPACQ